MFVRFRATFVLSAMVTSAVCWWPHSTADAFPYFARRYDVGCHTCHSVVPKLNETGLLFRERGYRMDRLLRPRVSLDT